MSWISVHEDVNGPKLRRLAKSLGCSKAEALGILNFLWLWGLRNADETGKVLYAERGDIVAVISPVTDISAKTVVDVLVSHGWVDEEDDCIYLHDWDNWQKQWYKYLKTLAADRKRKSQNQKHEDLAPPPGPPLESRGAEPLPPDQSVPLEEKQDNGEPQTPKENQPDKKKTPEKKKFADFVKMTEANYYALVKSYGKEFADACITELDLYKGSNGKTYKDDYRAILSWVVEKVNKKYPGLMRRSMGNNKAREAGQENPFSEWRENNE